MKVRITKFKCTVSSIQKRNRYKLSNVKNPSVSSVKEIYQSFMHTKMENKRIVIIAG